MKGLRVVVPTSLRQKILKELHDPYPGIVKMKTLARSYISWPKIDQDIEYIAKSCLMYQSNQKNPLKVSSVHAWEYPNIPWQKLHLDFAGPFMRNYFFTGN